MSENLMFFFILHFIFSSDYMHTVKQMMKHSPLKYFTLITGRTLGHYVDIEKKLQEGTGLQKVKNLEESDFILVFCPVGSRAGTDIEAAVKILSTQAGKTLIIPIKSCYLTYMWNQMCKALLNSSLNWIIDSSASLSTFSSD